MVLSPFAVSESFWAYLMSQPQADRRSDRPPLGTRIVRDFHRRGGGLTGGPPLRLGCGAARGRGRSGRGSHAVVAGGPWLERGDGVRPEALDRAHRLHLGLLGLLLLAVLRVAGIQHGLQDPPTGIDEPVVNLK